MILQIMSFNVVFFVVSSLCQGMVVRTPCFVVVRVLEKSSASCHQEALQKSIQGSRGLWIPEVYLWAGLSRSLWSLEGLLDVMIWAAADKLSLPSGRHCLPWLWSAA